MFKAYIFDLDGTLVDAYQAVAQTLNHALKELGYPPADDETVKREVGWGQRYLVEAFVREEDVEKVQLIFKDYHKVALRSGTKFLPGAEALLKKLREKKYHLAIATNRPRYSTDVILDHLQITDMFEMTLCGDELTNLKPHPEILERILTKFDVPPQEALYVGDMTIDVQTGQAAGVKTVAVVTGSSTFEELKELKPFKLCHHLDEMHDLV